MIVREGDDGDRFYIVAEGELDVTQDGRPISELEHGRLLRRDRPPPGHAAHRDRHRKTDVVLYALDREDFLAAVTGHPQSAEAAETVDQRRLAGSRRRPATIAGLNEDAAARCARQDSNLRLCLRRAARCPAEHGSQGRQVYAARTSRSSSRSSASCGTSTRT